MTTKQVASLVDEAIALDSHIAGLQLQLTSMKKELQTEAERLLREETDTLELPGCSYTFHGNNGHVANISFPKPKLISGFFFLKRGTEDNAAFRMKDGKMAEVGPIRELAGEAFAKLFSTQYKPAKAFRELCAAMLPKREAGKLIELCEEPSAPRVSFETKE